jgi:hypothetical protein
MFLFPEADIDTWFAETGVEAQQSAVYSFNDDAFTKYCTYRIRSGEDLYFGFAYSTLKMEEVCSSET